MSFPEILLLSLALSADAFSVGAVLGLRYRSPRQVFRLSFHFGLFQALLPLLGALMAEGLLGLADRWDHWIASSLLVLLGGRMLWAGCHPQDAGAASADLTRGWSLVGFSLAVSIDALAAGMTLPAAGAPVLTAVATFGVVAALATFVAMRVAGPLAQRLGSRAEIAAGLVLIGLGLKVLHDHLGRWPLG